MSKREIVLEDIIERILGGENLKGDLQRLKTLIKYQRTFDQRELEEIYQNLEED